MSSKKSKKKEDRVVIKKEVSKSVDELISESYTFGVLSLVFWFIPILGLIFANKGRTKLSLITKKDKLIVTSTTLNKIGFVIGLIVTSLFALFILMQIIINIKVIFFTVV